MLRNFIKLAWRNILKNRKLSIINLLGLSLSVAFCLLLIFYIFHEQSYDSFAPNKDRLFRLEMSNLFPAANPAPKKNIFSFLTQKEEVENDVIIPLIVGRDLQQNFPEVKSFIRFQDIGDQLVKVNNQTFKEKHVVFADKNFFSGFSFHVLKGGPNNVLNSKNEVVLSSTVAGKYFGHEDPIGKSIQIISDSARTFTVSGVAADAPGNSSIQYDLVIPLQADPNYENFIRTRFNSASHLLFIELKNGVSEPAFEQKINKWMKTYFTDYVKAFKDADMKQFHWFLRPLPECHYNLSPHWGHFTDNKNIYQLGCLMMVIILIASLNYILLAISGAAGRTPEVGVRKVMGANKRSIIQQFWIETQIIVLLSVLLGLVLCSVLLPAFNQVMDTSIQFRNIPIWEIVLVSLFLILSLGLFAGYYPAWLLSRMKPVNILKGFTTYKINPRFSTGLVVFQFACCVVLIMAAFVINLQMKYIRNRDLGFDKEQVLVVRNPTWDYDFTRRLKSRLYDFVQGQPSILAFSGMNGGLEGSYNTNGFVLNGQQQWRRTLSVDYNYFEMLGLKMLKGRTFSRSFPSDTAREHRPAVVNETLFHMLGKTARLGEYNEPLDATIIGVVKDYHFESLTKKIQPEEHRLTKDYVMNFMFKVKPGQMQPAISLLEKEWKEITSNYPFEYTFLDQTIAKMYAEDQRWQHIIEVSCFFAVFIACLGLFGLSAINAINRKKEIGIRKVLGAGVTDIVSTLSIKFMIWVAMAIVIAIPLAWWMMNEWLNDFAYRIQIQWWMFVVVGILAMAVGLFTISIQALKAATANPVKSLRSE